MNKNNTYINRRRSQIESFLRLYLGLQQLIYYPFYNIIIVALIDIFANVWKNRYTLFHFVYMPSVLVYILHQFVAIMLIVALILFVLIYIKTLGYLSARGDESKILGKLCNKDKEESCLILISRKKKKIGKKKVIIREFYTDIPMELWQKKKEDIEDVMDIRFIAPGIEYGGRNKDRGNRRIMYSVKRKKSRIRGEIYDEDM